MSRERPGSRRQPRRRSGRPFPTAWVITGLIVVGVIGALILMTRPTSEVAATEIECNRNEHFTQHVHANLRIYINGEQVPVPANVGIRPGDCLYWLHTHDSSGTIHVEAPIRDRVFTLGQFFQVWGRNLSSTELMGYQADETHQIKAWVNGEEYTGDPAEIPLRQHAVITLQYGPPFQPPHTHQFQPNE